MAFPAPYPPPRILTMNKLQLTNQPMMSGLCPVLNETVYMSSPGPSPPQEFLTANKLQLQYQQLLLGQIFQATYMGVADMQLQTGTWKYVLSITPGGGNLYFTNLLSTILNDVPSVKPIWKAITGPGDTKGQNDYRLWVEAEEASFSGLPAIANFKVERCTVEVDARPFSGFLYIVKIWVSVIQLA